MQKIDISKFKKQNSSGSSLIEKITALLNKDIQLFGNSLKDKHREHIYGELYTLLSSGIDIKTAFELIESQQDNKTVKRIINSILQSIIAGSTMSVAMEKTKEFSAYEYFSVQIGEEGGTLNKVLNELSTYYTNKIEQRRKVISALSYPAVVTLTAFFAIFFMLRFLVPMFDNVYKRFGGELPFLTQQLMKLSNFLVQYSTFIFLFIVGLIALYLYLRKTATYKKYSAIAVLKIPFIGTWIKKVYLSQFCSSMSMMLSSKVPLTKSIELINKQIEFYPFNEVLETIYKKIFQGESLYTSIHSTNFFNPKMETLIKVGEQVNQLDKMFEKLTQQYQSELELQSKIINTVLEPLIILILGGLVGIILVALYLPLFNLSSGFGL